MGQEKLLTWSVSEGGEITVVTFVLFRFILSSWTQNIRILHCQDVFPLQIGGNDTGPTFSTGWSGLFLCQRTWRAGKSSTKLGAILNLLPLLAHQNVSEQCLSVVCLKHSLFCYLTLMVLFYFYPFYLRALCSSEMWVPSLHFDLKLSTSRNICVRVLLVVVKLKFNDEVFNECMAKLWNFYWYFDHCGQIFESSCFLLENTFCAVCFRRV